MDGGTFEVTQPAWVSELTPAQQCVPRSRAPSASPHWFARLSCELTRAKMNCFCSVSIVWVSQSGSGAAVLLCSTRGLKRRSKRSSDQTWRNSGRAWPAAQSHVSARIDRQTMRLDGSSLASSQQAAYWEKCARAMNTMVDFHHCIFTLQQCCVALQVVILSSTVWSSSGNHCSVTSRSAQVCV